MLTKRKGQMFIKVTQDQALLVLESGKGKSWYDKPYRYNTLYAHFEYEEEQIICEMECYDEVLKLIHESEIDFKFYVFKGFTSRSDVLDYIDEGQSIKYHPDSKTYSIVY